MRRTVRTKPRIAVSVVTAAALLISVATACEPAPPPAVISINDLGPGADANPGDGLCETALGNGICTLTAAVDEGNALDNARILVPAELAYDGAVGFATQQISGQITLAVDPITPPNDVTAWGDAFEVAEGGSLWLEDVGVITQFENVIDGSLMMNRSLVSGHVSIGSSGTVRLLNSVITDTASPPVEPGTALLTNRGVFSAYFSDLLVHDGEDSPAVATLDDGNTTLGASTVLGTGTTGTAGCDGTPPLSAGYNRADGCGLTGPGDHESVVDGYDAVPLGELGCGTGVGLDFSGNVRPADYDADGIAACDVGAHEGH